MSREIDVEEAASWSQEELESNVNYLTQRVRWAELNRIEEILGSDAVEMPEPPAETEPVAEGTNETEDVPKKTTTKKKTTKSRTKKKG